MLLLSLQALIKPSKTRHLRNLIALCVLLTPMYSLANDHFSSWSDKTICRLAKTTPDNIEYQAESTSRGLSCGGAVTSTTTVKQEWVPLTSEVQQSTSSGNWFPTDVPMYAPHTLSQSGSPLLDKSHWSHHFAFADFDNNGTKDLFTITNPRQSGFDYTSAGPNCLTDLGDCYSDQGSISLIKMQSPRFNSLTSVTSFKGTDVSGLLVDNNPNEMKGTDSTDLHVADFNGDGMVDIFSSENVSINHDFTGKNDMYFLSQPDGSWLESTSTHVTGRQVKKGKGLINFSHGATVGDIDGDGDIDIVVMSINWVGNNGQILCYINRGDGHMKVRKCGNQWGFTVELGDIDNDGDLDIVFGSETHSAAKAMNRTKAIPGCNGSRCNGAFNGILLNDGKGNFNKRGFKFDDAVMSDTGVVPYSVVPAIGLADLDADDDLDVIRSHAGVNYGGAGMTIEENIGGGKFKTVLYNEFCKSPSTKAEIPTQEGTVWNCWASDFKFGDFNKDGLVDIYIEGHDTNKSALVQDGAIYMSTGNFEYDIVLPNDEDYPLHIMTIVK